MTDPKILVTGATGKTGRAVVELLLRNSVPVRALVRHVDDRSRALAAKGAEIVVAEPLDLNAMRTALEDISSAYFVPFFHPDMIKAAAIFGRAGEQTGLKSVVALSQWLASRSHPAWLTRQLWEMEQKFTALPFHSTIVAPPFFADNYLRLIGFAAHLGILPSLTGESTNAPPSNEDIAAVAVSALLDPPAHDGRRYVPTGPSLLSTSDMATVLTDILGRRVRRLEMPMWLFLKAARMQGVTPEELSGFRYWVRDHRQGAFSFHLPSDDVLRVTGRKPESFETIAQRYAAMPEAKRSVAKDAEALLQFMRTPIAPGYNLDRFDRSLRLSAPDDARLAMQNPEWRAERTRQMTSRLAPMAMIGEAA